MSLTSTIVFMSERRSWCADVLIRWRLHLIVLRVMKGKIMFAMDDFHAKPVAFPFFDPSLCGACLWRHAGHRRGGDAPDARNDLHNSDAEAQQIGLPV